MECLRKVKVLVNPNSGLGQSMNNVIGVMERHWAADDIELSYQVSSSIEQGIIKTRRAVEDGIDTLIVAGGDGVINTAGSVLMGSSTALGVLPTGSGNGFARHFGVPLQLNKAAEALRTAKREVIDVGTANEKPFFVTCSMAWDAAIVRSFEAWPFRGILPYIFSAATELIGYEPQPFEVVLDGKECLQFEDPLVFTVANLTQYGGGAQIAPQACADDGHLELVVIQRKDAGRAFSNIMRLFDGTAQQIPGLITRRFRHMMVHRQKAAFIQLDGELVESGADVEVSVVDRALAVLVPTKQEQLPI